MSNLNDLIKNLCPNGVEFKKLGEVCEFVRGPFGGSLKKDSFVEKGFAVYEQQNAIYEKFTFRYFVTEKKFLEMKRFAVKSGDLIMSCSGTMGKIAIIPEDAPTGIINQALLKLTPNGNISNKYLKYYFENSVAKVLNEQSRGGAIKNVASVSELKQILIPVPPLEVQSEIVRILDTFTELTARKKQYEYYRDVLLTFEETNNTIQTNKQTNKPANSI